VQLDINIVNHRNNINPVQITESSSNPVMDTSFDSLDYLSDELEDVTVSSTFTKIEDIESKFILKLEAQEKVIKELTEKCKNLETMFSEKISSDAKNIDILINNDQKLLNYVRATRDQIIIQRGEIDILNQFKKDIDPLKQYSFEKFGIGFIPYDVSTTDIRITAMLDPTRKYSYL
jgi:hypothetical protein